MAQTLALNTGHVLVRKKFEFLSSIDTFRVLAIKNDVCLQWVQCHPGLTRVRSIWFLLFKIKRVLVYNSTIFKLTDLFILYFFIQNVYANKKYIEKKVKKLCRWG